MRTHLFVTPDPIQKWPKILTALCRDVIANPQPVMTLDSDTGNFHAQSTLVFCKDCANAAISSVGKGRCWVYGVMTAEEAHRANLLNRAEDL